MDEFCFFTGKPDSSPNSCWKDYTMVRWRKREVNSFSPTIGIPAYLNGYAVIPLVAGMIEKGMTGNCDGFHGNRRRNFYSCRNGSTRFSLTWCFLQRSHFWTWCRIFGRLRIPALGRVFNANLTSCPEHAIIYSEVINLTFKVNSRKTFADISVICFQVFPDKKDNSPQCSFPSDFYPFNVSTACLLILPLQ